MTATRVELIEAMHDPDAYIVKRYNSEVTVTAVGRNRAFICLSSMLDSTENAVHFDELTVALNG